MLASTQAIQLTQDEPHDGEQLRGGNGRLDLLDDEMGRKEDNRASCRKGREQSKNTPFIGKVSRYLNTYWIIRMADFGRVGCDVY